MDHTELFDIARTQELATLASIDLNIPAPIRAELASGAAALSRAFDMIDAIVARDITQAQRDELLTFRLNLRRVYKSGIKDRTKVRFSDSGSKRAQRKRLKHLARLSKGQD